MTLLSTPECQSPIAAKTLSRGPRRRWRPLRLGPRGALHVSKESSVLYAWSLGAASTVKPLSRAASDHKIGLRWTMNPAGIEIKPLATD
jgi:hypothetical protein